MGASFAVLSTDGKMPVTKDMLNKSASSIEISFLRSNIYLFFKIVIHVMELQEKEAQKEWSIQEICLERIYSQRCLLILDLKPCR